MRKIFPALLVAILGASLYSFVSRAGVSCSVPFSFQNNTSADATQVNANFSAIITCLTNAASAGANTDITSLLGLTTPLGPGSGGSPLFAGGTTAGSANVQTLTTTAPNSFSLTSGYRVTFIAGNTNTAAMTLNVKSTGAVNVYRKTQLGATVTVGGEVIIGNPYTVVYNGANFVLDGDTIRVGTIEWVGGASAGPGRLLANGQAVSRTTYADLFSLYGTTYGIGDNVTTFNVPDLQGRVAVMKDGAGRLTTSCTASNTLGTACGSQNQTIAQTALPNVTLAVSGTINAYNTSTQASSAAPLNVNVPNVDAGRTGLALPISGSLNTVSINTGVTQTVLPTNDPSQIVNALIVF